jgi:antitoxin HicB
MKKQMQVLEYELPVTITPLKEGGYLAQSKKLQGCLAEAETVDQALSYIVDVARNIIDVLKEEGMKIPLEVLKNTEKKSKINFSIPLSYQSHA